MPASARSQGLVNAVEVRASDNAAVRFLSYHDALPGGVSSVSSELSPSRSRAAESRVAAGIAVMWFVVALATCAAGAVLTYAGITVVVVVLFG